VLHELERAWYSIPRDLRNDDIMAMSKN